ncbi:TIR domain-containing protein (plasmid) [Mycolicibacterium aichiense]|uniref:TIR domain-containing protein n=1 Tax=Mycolicibacterium aichiense TaxID=1799 RepID=UPI003D66F6C9
MKVFLSWSGDLSHSVAELLHDWLPSVLQTVDPFLSSSSIEKGSRWGTQLTAGLSASGFGLVLLTRENLSSPWMTFEAGALSEGLSSGRVCPLLVDLEPSDVIGPLAEFQGCRITKEDMSKLITTMNRSSEDNSVDVGRLGRLFEAMWPDLESGVNNILIAHADKHQTATKETPSSRTFKLLASRGTLINPSDESRNIAFKVETVNLLLGELAAALTSHQTMEEAQDAFERAGHKAALVFADKIYEKWGLEYPDDTVAERIERWCSFDSDVGWGRLINDLDFDEESGDVSGAIRLVDNFQTYKRNHSEVPDCYLMHGYVRGVLETLLDGTPLTVECDVTVCPLYNRLRKDCVFQVKSRN